MDEPAEKSLKELATLNILLRIEKENKLNFHDYICFFHGYTLTYL